MNKNVKNLTVSALCLATAMVLPLLTGQIPQIGSALSPMHIPILLCGFLCGPYYALLIGAVAPLLRFMLLGMPPLFPVGIAMCFELAVYGLAAGILYNMLTKKTANIYVSLIAAMILGRIVWGIAMVLLLGATKFTFAVFISGALLNAIPGIIVHIALIPILVMALDRRGHLAASGT